MQTPTSQPSTGYMGAAQHLPTPRVLWRVFAVLFFGAFANALLPSGTIIIGGLLVVHALRGPRQSVEALTVLGVLLMMNRIFIRGDISMLRWVILFAATGRMAWDSVIKSARWPRIIWPLFLFVGVVLVLTALTSRLPAVSLLKIVSFTVGATTVLVSMYRTQHLRPYWTSWFFTVGLVVLVLSMLLYPTSLGFMVNGTSFQGILTHPQTTGIFAALFAAFSTGLLHFGRHRTIPVWAMAGMSWFVLFMSLSRTAALAAALGLGGVLAIRYLTGKWKQRKAYQGIDVLPWLAGLMVVTVLVWKGPAIGNRITDFLLKDDSAVSVTESLQQSRMGLIQRSMDNFWQYPLTGIGFGVPSNENLDRVETGALGLPVGASTEKGFLPAAVLEETGIVGFVLWVTLIAMLFRITYRQGTATQFWVLAVCILVNAGEAIFFAIGGNGLFMWLLIGFALLPPAQHPPPGPPPPLRRRPNRRSHARIR